MTTGHEVWLARRNAGLSQIQLGKQLGVSGATISYWERKAGEKVKPNNGAAARLEEFVGDYTTTPVTPVVVPENLRREFWSKQNAKNDAFNFDRAPETKRRWWQRFGRKK